MEYVEKVTPCGVVKGIETERCLEFRSIRYAHAGCKSALLRIACGVPALLGAIGYDGTLQRTIIFEFEENLYGI